MVLPFHQIGLSHPKRLAVYLTNENFTRKPFLIVNTAAVRFESLSHYLQQ
jgi:hypothetical protein